MAKEKVIEYETVERQREITVCDECGSQEEETDAIVKMMINPVQKRFSGEWQGVNQDICLSCVEKHFDIDIPEDEVVDNLNFKNGDIQINTIKETTALFNSVEYKSKNWLIGDIFLFPLLLIFLIAGQGWEEEENENYAFLIGMSGSLLWFSAAILTYLFIL